MRARFSVAVGLVALGLVALSFGLAVSSTTARHRGLCERLAIPLCRGIWLYNETIMPNLMNNANQDEAGLEVHRFLPLVETNCSPDLKFFLCFLYAPPCTVFEEPIPPCRSVCASARLGCERLLNRHGFAWPENLECSRFPDAGSDKLCIPEDVYQASSVDAANSTEASAAL